MLGGGIGFFLSSLEDDTDTAAAPGNSTQDTSVEPQPRSTATSGATGGPTEDVASPDIAPSPTELPNDRPVSVEAGPRWIGVITSLNADDYNETDGWDHAVDHGARLGTDVGLLHSDMYPSLNPNLWVVYIGPYPDEATAASACTGIDNCYPRILSNSADDRYCMSADGCTGRTRDDD